MADDAKDEEAPKGELDAMEKAATRGRISHPPEPDRNPCKFPDLLFAVAWIGAVIAMVAIAIEYGWNDVGSAEYDDDDEKHRKHRVKRLVKIFILMFVFALLLAQLALSIMMRFGGSMIHASFVMMEAVILAAAIAGIEVERYYLAGFCFFVLALLVLFHCCAWTRIRFAAATLHTGCEIVLAYPLLELAAFFGCVVAVFFFFIFAIAIYGYWNYKINEASSKQGVVIVTLILFLILFWTQQVFKYIMIATTAGTAHSWWYGRLPTIRDHPTLGALARASTYNLGAICFGAFFVAIVETIMVCVAWMRRTAKRSPGGCCVNCILGCVACFLGCCEALLEYFNKYAFVFVGIHGYSYLYAGKQVVDLFSTHGFTVVGADFFIDMVFFVFQICIGVTTALFGVLLVQRGPDDWTKGTSKVEVFVGIAGGLGGLFIAGVVFAVVDGANKAVLVLFSENPHVLELAHPDDHKRLSDSWGLVSKSIKHDDDDDDDDQQH
mmetsp:Transcript_10638/g.43025  ORF Transcript_10638/g.43025 Transcript_10638/m.43025 type:complete len:494 (-) Transcript_10638:329-1810(-)